MLNEVVFWFELVFLFRVKLLTSESKKTTEADDRSLAAAASPHRVGLGLLRVIPQCGDRDPLIKRNEGGLKAGTTASLLSRRLKGTTAWLLSRGSRNLNETCPNSGSAAEYGSYVTKIILLSWPSVVETE